MGELEITIFLRYSIPEKGLTSSGPFRGLEKDEDLLMKSIFRLFLKHCKRKQ
jgi:hypothetical protein